jgi:hypothetical protein
MTRLLDQPRRLHVVVGECGAPQTVTLSGGADARSLEVIRVWGRWRVAVGWWREPVARECWKLGLGRAGSAEPTWAVEIYRDLGDGSWWLNRVQG